MQNKRLHIALFTVWFPSKSEPLFGIFVLKQAQLIARECDVTVFLVRRSLVPSTRSYSIGNISVREQRGPYLPNTSTARLTHYATYFEKIFSKRNAEKPIDLVHSHDYVALHPAHIISQKANIPHISSMHNTDFLLGEVSPWRKDYIAVALDACTKVIAVGHELSVALRLYSVSADITVIPNLIDDTTFRLGTPRDKTPIRFLFVGYFEPKKNVMLILNAFSQLGRADARLTLIGEGSQLQEMRKYIKQHELDSTVSILGPIANDELPQHYQTHHCYVSASQVETFGVTVLEAMACGLHIIYGMEGEVKNIVPKAGALAVATLEVSALAAAMAHMMEYYDESRSESIRQHFQAHFSSMQVLARILDLYTSATPPLSKN